MSKYIKKIFKLFFFLVIALLYNYTLLTKKVLPVVEGDADLSCVFPLIRSHIRGFNVKTLTPYHQPVWPLDAIILVLAFPTRHSEVVAGCPKSFLLFTFSLSRTVSDIFYKLHKHI